MFTSLFRSILSILCCRLGVFSLSTILVLAAIPLALFGHVAVACIAGYAGALLFILLLNRGVAVMNQAYERYELDHRRVRTTD